MGDIFGYMQQLETALALLYKKLFYDVFLLLGVGYALQFMILMVLVVLCFGVYRVASAIHDFSEAYRWRGKDRE